MQKALNEKIQRRDVKVWESFLESYNSTNSKLVDVIYGSFSYEDFVNILTAVNRMLKNFNFAQYDKQQLEPSQPTQQPESSQPTQQPESSQPTQQPESSQPTQQPESSQPPEQQPKDNGTTTHKPSRGFTVELSHSIIGLLLLATMLLNVNRKLI